MEDIFMKQIESGITEMRNWMKDDVCLVFPMISDLHSNIAETDSLNSQKRICINHLDYLFKTAQKAGADFAADLGDDGFDVPLKTETDCMELLNQMESRYQRSTVPAIHVVGNHDLYVKSMNGSFWGSWLKKINAGKMEFVTGDDGSYGYFDLPAKLCRIFFLNTSDVPNGFSPAQLAFLKTRLTELSSDQTAVVLTHVCPLNRARWRSANPAVSPFRFPELSMILHDFTESGGRLAGVFSGDSHACYFDFIDGVNYFVTQGYGGCSPETEKPQQMTVFHQYNELLKRSDSFDTKEFCLIELAAVKLEKREIRLFRIGAGGFEFFRGAKF